MSGKAAQMPSLAPMPAAAAKQGTPTDMSTDPVTPMRHKVSHECRNDSCKMESGHNRPVPSATSEAGDCGITAGMLLSECEMETCVHCNTP